MVDSCVGGIWEDREDLGKRREDSEVKQTSGVVFLGYLGRGHFVCGKGSCGNACLRYTPASRLIQELSLAKLDKSSAWQMPTKQ